jgi:hypothetical protein
VGFQQKACEGLCVPVGAVPLVSETNNGDGLTFAFTAALTAILINSGADAPTKAGHSHARPSSGKRPR